MTCRSVIQVAVAMVRPISATARSATNAHLPKDGLVGLLYWFGERAKVRLRLETWSRQRDVQRTRG